jgi:transcriptional regulator with XRE-family HTH domain
MTDPSAIPTIGDRVKVIRRRRGITQDVLAGRIGLTRSAIANYENGTRPVDSRMLQLALAAALGVTVGDLTGHEEDKLDPAAAEFHQAVPEIESLLWTRGDATDNRPPLSLGALSVEAERAMSLIGNGDYTTLGPMLAPMLADSFRHVRDSDTSAAWDVHSLIVFGLGAALRHRGYHSLAWTAAQESERAAAKTDSVAASAAATFRRGQVMLRHPGALSTALEDAEETAERIAGDVRTVADIETFGMLWLQASLVKAALGGDPESHLDEAAEQADRLTAAPTDSSIMRNRTFGPANVALWRMSAAMERREPGQVLALAPTLAPADLPSEGRRAQYFVEIGRAHAVQKSYRESLHMLLRAEHIAPQHVRGMTSVRELVGHMMRTAQRDLTTGDLGRLAQRVGVVPA